MYEVANIGIYDNNHKLYEVTSDTRHGKTNQVFRILNRIFLGQ